MRLDGPLTVAYGGGTNSTAMLIGMVERNILPGLITFADTGAERPETYEFIGRMQTWLVSHDMPEIVVVQNDGVYGTLERECQQKAAMPSLVYGWKSCSDKYKRRPQEKAINEWTDAQDAWAAGGKVVRAIGFGLGEEHRAERSEGDHKYANWYPLIEWEWDRDECREAIERAGLPQPGKSACYFCPASTKREVLELRDKHPDLFAQAVTIERMAVDGHAHTVKGLGRRWSWEALASADEAQMRLWADPPPIACACFDGDHDE